MKVLSCRLSYHGKPRARARRGGLACLSGLLGALVLGGLSAGCSFSYQLDSMFGKKDEKAEHTGSAMPQTAATTGSSAAPEPTEPASDTDLVFARQAAADVLSRGGKDTSAPWENPRTGARGTVTPIAAAYTQDGFVCRDFLASYVRKGSEAWLQGEACRLHQGKWEVRSLKPWKRS